MQVGIRNPLEESKQVPDNAGTDHWPSIDSEIRFCQFGSMNWKFLSGFVWLSCWWNPYIADSIVFVHLKAVNSISDPIGSSCGDPECDQTGDQCAEEREQTRSNDPPAPMEHENRFAGRPKLNFRSNKKIWALHLLQWWSLPNRFVWKSLNFSGDLAFCVCF